MKNSIFELVVNILTYAIKNKETSFSQKEFKNVVYTQEFNNFNINEEITDGFEYLLRRGLLQLENSHVTFYEKYRLSNNIKVNVKNNTEIFKELSKKIIFMYESKNIIDDNNEIKDEYALILEAVKLTNAGFLSQKDKEEIKITLSKILLSLNIESKAAYSLLTIIQLLELKSAVKVELETNNCQFVAQNVKFHHLQFNDESMVLYFDKCSFEIDSIKDIKKIESLDELPLQKHLEKSIKLLENYSNEDLIPLKEFLQSYLN